MNFFSWHFPLHEFFLGFFLTPPPTPITFLMVRPLRTFAWEAIFSQVHMVCNEGIEEK